MHRCTDALTHAPATGFTVGEHVAVQALVLRLRLTTPAQTPYSCFLGWVEFTVKFKPHPRSWRLLEAKHSMHRQHPSLDDVKVQYRTAPSVCYSAKLPELNVPSANPSYPSYPSYLPSLSPPHRTPGCKATSAQLPTCTAHAPGASFCLPSAFCTSLQAARGCVTRQASREATKPVACSAIPLQQSSPGCFWRLCLGEGSMVGLWVEWPPL